jgi:hypothetical protein
LLKGFLLRVRPNLGPEVAQKDKKALNKSQVREGIKKIKGIIEKTPIEIDAGKHGDLDKIIGEHFLPEPLYLIKSGKKAVTADVKIISFVCLGPGQASHLVGFLQHKGTDASFDQFMGSRKTCRTGANNDNRFLDHQQSPFFPLK